MKTEYSVSRLLSHYPPPIGEIVAKLRDILRTVAPEAAEQANPGWKSISFRHPRLGYFCGIFPFEDRVQLVFEFGVLLPDPDNILQGDGKQVRYLTFNTLADVHEQPLKSLVQAALELPEALSVRRSLVTSGAKPAQPPDAKANIRPRPQPRS